MRRLGFTAVAATWLLALWGGAAPAAASFSGADLFVPAVGRAAGQQGSAWYTSLWLHNPGAEPAQVTVELLRRGQANPRPELQALTVPAGATLAFADCLIELYGLESALGALRIRSTQPVVAGARVFNQPGESLRESQGQLMPGLPGRLAVAAGGSTDIPGVAQPANGDFRTNFGLVETRGGDVEVELVLFDEAGVELASGSLDLRPFEPVQISLAELAPDAAVSAGRLHVAVTGGSGAVLAYASAVANGTLSQDPTTLTMELDPDLLGGDGISAVVAGPGLSGGGSSGEVTVAARAGDGIAVSGAGIAVRPGGLRAEHVAPGQLVLGAKVGESVLHDVVTFAAGPGVTLSSAGNTVTIAAGAAGQRLEQPLTRALNVTAAGAWSAGSDRLRLPSAGRWRVGYRVVVQVQNVGVGTLSDPVNVVLVSVTDSGALVRGSLSVVGLPLGISGSATQLLTVAGEGVITVTRATELAIAARSAGGSLRVTVHPHDADLSPALSAPDGSSYLYAESLGG